MVDGEDDPEPNAQGGKKLKYRNQLLEISNRERNQLIIDLNDLEAYERATTDDEHNYKLIESIERNAHHYIEVFSRAVDKCLPAPTKELKYVLMFTWIGLETNVRQLQGRCLGCAHDTAR